jgi:D-alanine-D-alanine ligase-like ATP-grasp enzyme
MEVKLLIIYGGIYEYEISYKSANFIYDLVAESELNITPFFLEIAKDGSFIHTRDMKFRKIVTLVRGGLLSRDGKINVIAAFNLMHSSDIQDSGFQLSLLNSFGVNSIAPSLETLNITTNKLASYDFVDTLIKERGLHISLPRYQMVSNEKEIEASYSSYNKTVIKARDMGSSCGVIYCDSPDKYMNAFHTLNSKSKPPFIIEEYIENDFLLYVVLLRVRDKVYQSKTMAVFKGKINGILGYKEKYIAPCPARVISSSELPDGIYDATQENAEIFFKALPGTSPILRVDYTLSRDGTLYLGEFENIPGMSVNSLVNVDKDSAFSEHVIEMIEEAINI